MTTFAKIKNAGYWLLCLSILFVIIWCSIKFDEEREKPPIVSVEEIEKTYANVGHSCKVFHVIEDYNEVVYIFVYHDGPKITSGSYHDDKGNLIRVILITKGEI